MIDQSYIDQKVTQYVMSTGKKPRFVLLDIAAFDKFTEMLKPKELIEIAVYHSKTPNGDKVARMCCSADCWVDVLSVNTENSLFEVVG
jgi:hypothetical protein